MTKEITFQVGGDPKPKGSMSAFCVNWPRKPNYYKKVLALCRRIIAEFVEKRTITWRPHVELTSSTKGLKPWEGKVAQAAQAAMAAEPQPWEEGVAVIVEFYVKRPQNHMGTGKNAGTIKEWAKRKLATSIPDVDKLLRAVNDAMTGIVYKDDAQIIFLAGIKKYGRKPGIRVKCFPVSLPEEIPEPEQLMLDLL